MTSAGVTSADAATRRAQYGPNGPGVVRRLAGLRPLVRRLLNPAAAILLGASAVGGPGAPCFGLLGDVAKRGLVRRRGL